MPTWLTNTFYIEQYYSLDCELILAAVALLGVYHCQKVSRFWNITNAATASKK